MRILDSGGMSSGVRMGRHFARAWWRVAVGGLRGDIELLHIHVAAYGSVVRKAPFVLLGRLLGVPVVLHGHGADFDSFFERAGSAGRWLITALFRQAAAVIVLGARSRAHMIDRVGVDARRVHVLANAVPDAVHRPRSPSPRCRLMFLGALTERKGLPELFDALARPELAQLDWTLDLVGNGDRATWQGVVDRLQLGDRVHLLGWIPSAQARAMLTEADALVLPSRQEALPMVILEAMSAGLPVVATEVGDVREAVHDGVNGLTVPPGDAEALAAALARLIASPELRAALGEAGRRRFEAAFDIRSYGDRLAAIFARAPADAARRLRFVSTRTRTETP